MPQSKLKSSREVPTDANALVGAAIASGDIHAAAAVYEIASTAQRDKLVEMMFAERRNALMFARWEHTPSAVLDCLAGTQDDMLKLRLEKHPGTSGNTLNHLYGNEKREGLILLIAQHRQAPSHLLEKLASASEDTMILKAVAGNPAAGALAIRLIDHRMPALFDREICSNAATPKDVLKTVYRRGDAYLRAAVVAHGNCQRSIIEQAVHEAEPIVLRQLAQDKRIDAGTLARLAKHADVTVRRGIAANLATPERLTEVLALDEAAVVRRAVAGREDLNLLTMHLLARDSDHWVRQWLARNPRVPADLLRQLALDDETEVRRAVGRNPHCPIDLLELLATDKDAWVRAAVAYQCNATEELMIRLGEDDAIDVLSGVAANARTPELLLKQLAVWPEPDVRRGVIFNKRVTRQTLLTMLEDPYYLHRILLIGKPVLHAKDKWGLHDDPDHAVRFTVFKWFSDRFKESHTC